jgi:hypothetical protein
MDGFVAGAGVTDGGGNVVPLLAGACGEMQSGADSVPAAPSSDKFELEPVILRRRPVGKENGRAIETSGYNIHASVAIEIGERRATKQTLRAKLLWRKDSGRGLTKKQATLLGMVVGE